VNMDTLMAIGSVAAYFLLMVSPFIVVLLGLLWIVTALHSRKAEQAVRPVMYCWFGILFPLLVFFASAGLVPQWKGGCHFGWLDCFHTGKLALTPLVLWACVAFVAVEQCKAGQQSRAWVVLGLFMGAVVSTVCLVLGVIINCTSEDALFLLVPGYVAGWYSTLCIRAMRASTLKPWSYVCTLLGSVPFWVTGVFWSKDAYAALAETPPNSCFVVTAAAQGHAAIVGPFTCIERRGETRVVNRQLLTFWEFETIWQRRFPITHGGFRRIYNFVGPYVARSIRAKVVADAVYLLLKPCEVMAAIAVSLSESSARKPIQGQHDI